MNNTCHCQNDPESKKDLDEVIEFLKIINEKNRLKILCFLSHGEECVCAIWENLELPQNLTSHHLKALRDFGLIESRQDGRKIIYWTKKEVVKKYTLLLNNFLISNL